MSVRAKFYVSSTPEKNENGNPDTTPTTVRLGAVCRGIENSMWAQYTPAGSITLSIKNDLAAEQFQYGDEYEVTFRKVAKPTIGDGHSIVEARTKDGTIICEFCGLTLRYTEDSVAKWPHVRAEMTPEKDADRLAVHEQHYGPAKMQAIEAEDAPDDLRDLDFASMTRVLGGVPTCLIFSRVNEDGHTVISHSHTDGAECNLDVQVAKAE